MSYTLVERVLSSSLPARLKLVAMALARFADDDGYKIFPGVTRIAHMVGRSPRRVQAAIHDLRRMGLLEIIEPHGPHRATHYWLNERRLPIATPEQLPLDFPQVNCADSEANRGFPQLQQAYTGRFCREQVTLPSPDPIKIQSVTPRTRARARERRRNAG